MVLSPTQTPNNTPWRRITPVMAIVNCLLRPLSPLQLSNKRQKTNEGSVSFTKEDMTTQQQLQAMFALQRVNGLPENNIPFHPPNATAKIKDTNEGGAKSVKLSSGEARAACGKRKQEFNTFRARAVSLSHHQKSKEKPTSMKYRVSKTKASYSQLCSHEGCAKAVVQGGVCVQHGAKVNRCGQEGCTNQTQKGGVCKRHGAKVKTYICSHEGCTSQAT